MKFTYPSGSRPLEGYTIKRGIGQGGFGEVYYATSDAGKEVALKLIRRNLDVELRGVTQCLNLKHPSLLALYDIKVDERGDSWVIMEYVSGESLEDMLARHPDGMPIDEALSWFHGIAAGVAYLHDRGIVHRDLKPGNIFNDDGQVKIGDYGLSKFISASRRSGQTESVGTVHYMAPEIANGRYGKEIDIYALGIILYELLTGQVPFEGESVGEVLMKHLTAEPDVSRIPEPFRGIVAHTLAKDPQQRVHSVAELVAALPVQPSGFATIPPRRRPDPSLAETTLLAGSPPPATPAPPPPLVHVAVRGETTDDEPILRALREAWQQIRDGWQRANFNTPTKIILCIAGIWLLIYYAKFVVPAVFFGGVAYAGYRGVRWFLITKSGSTAATAAAPLAARPDWPAAPARPTPPAPPGIAPGAPRMVSYSRRERRGRRRDSALRVLPPKSPRERFTELVGSLLLSTAVAGAATLLMLIVQQRDLRADGPEYVWLALTGTLGAWGVLIPAKFWEGRQGDAVLRRFVLLGVGLAFGLLAWEAAQFLNVALLNELKDMPHVAIEAHATHDAEGQPQILGYLAYFGFLFLLVRWWRQADPLRSSRLSLWSAIVCVFWAGVLNAFWQFPQPWGMMAAATISIAVQLSSPWLDPQHRLARAPVAPAGTA
ncbi:MAG: serine/threonine protein kinase [Planctomycetia bacterium]|nr:serine/threonine protein kinase [Planctomycetia bacterium]